MSAYVVSPDTIDYLVTASRLWRLAGDGYLPYETRNLTDNELGQILLAENVRSVNARYNETDETPEYEYRDVRFDAIDAVTVLKSVQCLNYQSCETDDWKTTTAYKVLQAIESGAIAHLRGYREAPWGWTREQATPALKAVR